jgi:hypothetical protein
MSFNVAASSGQRTGRRRSPGTDVGVAPAGEGAAVVAAEGVFVVVITRPA